MFFKNFQDFLTVLLILEQLLLNWLKFFVHFILLFLQILINLVLLNLLHANISLNWVKPGNDDLWLLLNKLLDWVYKTLSIKIRLTFKLVNWNRSHQDLEWLDLVEEFHQDIIFSVKLTLEYVLQGWLIRDDWVINLWNECNQEVEQNNQVNELICKPHEPN